jgi:Flp pilus assembly pilin Flp
MEETMTHAPTQSSLHLAAARFCHAFWREEDGASLVEYVLLVALIAAVCLGAVTLLGSNANTKLGTASNALK